MTQAHTRPFAKAVPLNRQALCIFPQVKRQSQALLVTCSILCSYSLLVSFLVCRQASGSFFASLFYLFPFSQLFFIVLFVSAFSQHLLRITSSNREFLFPF
jgi:hypothetical protein